MKSLISFFAAVAASSLTASAASFHTEARTYPVSRDGYLRIEANAANVRIEPTTASVVKLLVSESTRCEHLSQIDVTVAHSANLVSINAFSHYGQDSEAELLVQVPEGFHVTVHDAHGDVSVGRIKGALEIETQKGNIVLARQSAQDRISAKSGRVIVGVSEFQSVQLRSELAAESTPSHFSLDTTLPAPVTEMHPAIVRR